MNRTWLQGHVVADAEHKVTTTGKDVTQFRVATNEGFGASRESEYHTIVAWDDLAKDARANAKKGTEVFVVGRLKTRSWEDKNSGEKKYRTEVIAKTIEYAPRRNEEPLGEVKF